MIKNIKKLIFITIFFLAYSFTSFADNSHFIDFKKVLNSSTAGAGAQKSLKTKFDSESKKFNKLEVEIKKEESEIISQKKALSPEEYKKKVESLRKRVANLQKNKQDSFNKISKSRNDAKQALLKAVNPIVKKYMEDNKIRIVLNKQSVILGDATLEITDEIIKILNKEFPSLKAN
jgi:Skp family chaperone for outer membrane proteins|tara:strand:- start:275 stop:802 length:528 start_codon:yes stop_codon:yes gene_type:complete